MKAKITALEQSMTGFILDALSSLICIAIGVWIVGQQISAIANHPFYAN